MHHKATYKSVTAAERGPVQDVAVAGGVGGAGGGRARLGRHSEAGHAGYPRTHHRLHQRPGGSRN